MKTGEKEVKGRKGRKEGRKGGRKEGKDGGRGRSIECEVVVERTRLEI